MIATIIKYVIMLFGLVLMFATASELRFENDESKIKTFRMGGFAGLLIIILAHYAFG